MDGRIKPGANSQESLIDGMGLDPTLPERRRKLGHHDGVGGERGVNVAATGRVDKASQVHVAATSGGGDAARAKTARKSARAEQDMPETSTP